MAERPKELIYAGDEKPPAIPLIAVGFQHVAVICPYLVMVALVVGAAKLPQEAARNAMGLAMIAVAFLTVLQSLRLGWIGSVLGQNGINIANFSLGRQDTPPRPAEVRQALARKWVTVSTQWGDVRMKVASLNGTVTNYAPEYEDCRRIAVEQQVPLKSVMQEAVQAYVRLK